MEYGCAKRNLKPGTDAYYAAPSNCNSNPENVFANNFKQIEKPVIVPEYRGGIEMRQCYVHRQKDYLGGLNAEMKIK